MKHIQITLAILLSITTAITMSTPPQSASINAPGQQPTCLQQMNSLACQKDCMAFYYRTRTVTELSNHDYLNLKSARLQTIETLSDQKKKLIKDKIAGKNTTIGINSIDEAINMEVAQLMDEETARKANHQLLETCCR